MRTIDLGAIATEFLILAIDPYPRKPGAVFQSPSAGEPAAHPFAALAALKKGQGGETELMGLPPVAAAAETVL